MYLCAGIGMRAVHPFPFPFSFPYDSSNSNETFTQTCITNPAKKKQSINQFQHLTLYSSHSPQQYSKTHNWVCHSSFHLTLIIIIIISVASSSVIRYLRHTREICRLKCFILFCIDCLIIGNCDVQHHFNAEEKSDKLCTGENNRNDVVKFLAEDNIKP